MATTGPPGGLPPDVSAAPSMLRAIWIMDGIAALVVALRLFASVRVLRKISLPDYLMVAALLFGIANNAVITVSSHWGLGRHIFYLTPVQIVNALKYQTIAEPLGILSPTLGRVSFAVYMLNLVGTDRTKRYILHFCIWFSVLINVLCIILIFVQCGSHPEAIYNTHAPGASKCWSKTVQAEYGYFQGAANSLVDLILTALPAWVVWHLQLPQRLRIGLSVLLGLSLFACVASIIKTVKLQSLGDGGDITHKIVPFVIWFTVENNVVIVAASVPAIRPLFVKKKDPSGYGSYPMKNYEKGGSGASGSGNGNGSSNNRPRTDDYDYNTYNTNHSQVQSTGAVDGFRSGRGIMKATTVTQMVDRDEEDARPSRDDSELELTHHEP